MKNKTVFISGGSSGIGKAAACKFSAEGLNVVIASRNEKQGRAVEVELNNLGGSIKWVKCDVTREPDVRHAIDFTLENFGSLDLAFNNGGSGAVESPLVDLNLLQWHECIEGYLTSVWLCMKYELKAMLENNIQGVIVNNSSAAGLKGFPGNTAYSASKHGVIGLTKSAALEYADKNIRINAVCPGWIATPPIISAMEKDRQFAQRIESEQSLGRAGNPDEVASLVYWLCSNEASFVTGSVIPIDGG